MTLFRLLLGAPVVAATLLVAGIAAVEVWQNIALLRNAERIPARIHARRAADDVTAVIGEGDQEQEIPVRAAFHHTLNLLDRVTLLKPKEGLPVVATPFQLWMRPVSALFFALVWIGFTAWLLPSAPTPPSLPSPLLFELHAAPGYWKGPAFWSLLPLTLLGVALFGKQILLPARLLMLSGGLVFLILLIGLIADKASLTIAAWPGAVQRQSIVSWEKADLTRVKRLVNFRSVHYKYSSTLKKYTRDSSISGTMTLQLRDDAGAVLVKIDEALEPAEKRDELLAWLQKQTDLRLEYEETPEPN
ncbi:MAG TPA: hypothetical protein VE981_02725 [Planctomycetota bacterium]|nr:hypothetical protein [Planctomycetota bacterium]